MQSSWSGGGNDMHNPKLILDYVYDREAAQPDEVLLVQPVGGDRVVEYTWRRMLDEARRMAAHLKSRDFEPGARSDLVIAEMLTINNGRGNDNEGSVSAVPSIS
jgi:acyl-CoA synthetase (AMP-forming)/AMP-acid ligase II